MVSPLEMYNKFGLANWIYSSKWGKLVGKWSTAISSSANVYTLADIFYNKVLTTHSIIQNSFYNSCHIIKIMCVVN